MSDANNDININPIEQKDTGNKVTEIAASSIRSGLAELEMRTSKTLQLLENVRLQPNTSFDNNGVNLNDTENMISAQQQQQHQQLKPQKIVSTSLQGDRKAPPEILKGLENLIAFTDSDDDAEFPLPALDDVSHLALISHSIVAYLTHLDRQQLARVTAQISGDTTSWLANIFRFIDAAASYHTDNAEATLRALRLAIISRCPGFLEGGVPALTNPCVYISENMAPQRLQFACRQLGIPLEAIRQISSNATLGTMDVSLLIKQIQVDLNTNKTPLLVIADIGSSLCGFVDNLHRLREVCKTHNIWLHATGHSLASLAVTRGPGTISSVSDSIVINLGSWLGIPSVPIVLLHKQLQNTALSAFESDPILSRRLTSLSLWTTLQALGRDIIADKILLAFQTVNVLYEIVSKCDGLRVLSHRPGGQANITLSNIVHKPIDTNVLFEVATPVVVFQFDGSSSLSDQENGNITPSTTGDQNQDLTQAIINKSIEKVANAAYFDRLNSWLGQIMQRDCPNLDFEIVDHQIHGTCIRFCPFELGLSEQPPSAENLETFSQCLESHVDILRATIKHKATFTKLVEKSSVLRLVHLPDWAGMGGVRFVPEGWETLLTDQAKTELNKLNTDLVEALQSTDNAFSLGEGPDGLICVRFGMVTHDTDVGELLDLVISVGKSVQENSRVLDSMSEIVKKGIEAATADLQRETEEKLWQEGILRHVPVFGRVFNWWLPPPKETGIKGRSLNLTQGVVESTENIYKYHMQMTGIQNKLHGNKSPPTPMVQTSVGVTISPGHSRNVSQSSTGSGGNQGAIPNVITNPNTAAIVQNQN